LLQTGICLTPKRILAISFKKDAARNLAERVAKRCPAEQARRFNSMTFDAFTKGLWDRFRSALPSPYNSPRAYKIVVPGRRDYDEFLTRHGFHVVNRQSFEKELSLADLPIDLSNDSTTQLALKRYWDEQFFSSDDILLSFPMINRLVKLLLQSNSYIHKALQTTYPFVFLDEFQDTTYAQYDLLQTAFAERQAVFTAVGDDKQRIMSWAGAMSDAFPQFETDFSAKRVSLLLNWRSHEELVHIQHEIARLIDNNVAQVQAKGVRTVEGAVATIWKFQRPDLESNYLAQWISHEVLSECIKPHDVAILIRMRANDVEREIAPAFEQQGLRIRNVDRAVGEIKIQDLLGEELTGILLPLLRLGAMERSPKDWEAALRNQQFLDAGNSTDVHLQQRLQNKLGVFVQQLKAKLACHLPDQHSVEEIVKMLFEFVTPATLRQAFPAYQRKEDFERVRTGFVTLLKECAEHSSNWKETLDEFEGIDQVALMTVHKSKGLEFHTMIFYGLDNQTWWSLIPNKREELNTFFVAFTRARQRAFFSRCTARGNAIDWIEQILGEVGVNTIDGTTILNFGIIPSRHTQHIHSHHIEIPALKSRPGFSDLHPKPSIFIFDLIFSFFRFFQCLFSLQAFFSYGECLFHSRCLTWFENLLTPSYNLIVLFLWIPFVTAAHTGDHHISTS